MEKTKQNLLVLEKINKLGKLRNITVDYTDTK